MISEELKAKLTAKEIEVGWVSAKRASIIFEVNKHTVLRWISRKRLRYINPINRAVERQQWRISLEEMQRGLDGFPEPKETTEVDTERDEAEKK